MNKTYLKLIGFAVALTMMISVFSAVSMILELDDNGVIIFQIMAFFLSSVLLCFYMKKKDSTLKQFGFEKKPVSKTIYGFIVIVILVQPIILGIDLSLPLSTIALIMIQMVLVGFAEETLFRGIFFYFLKNKNPKTFILFSSIVFGILHIASGLNPEAAPLLVVLQIINALLLGAVFACLYFIVKSIYLVIGFHALFNIFASVTPAGSIRQNIIAVVLLIIIYIIFITCLSKQIFTAKKAPISNISE